MSTSTARDPGAPSDSHFTLEVTTETAGRRLVHLRLTGPAGDELAERQVEILPGDQAMWAGIFDLRRHVQLHQGAVILDGHSEPATAEQLMERMGVFIGAQVLGQDIMQALLDSPARRTLLVHLPAVGGKDDEDKDPLASAFARVPWEIAQLAPGAPRLSERNVVVRAITEATEDRDQLVAERAREVTDGGKPLRMLLVFAQAPGSRPLAARREREQLMRVFERHIMQKLDVEVDVLCHGVTRALLEEQIRSSHGYHIIHWSGHGHHNMLELLGEDGAADYIEGKDLVELIEKAGGYVPQLVFLSSCLSGTVIRARDWAELQAALRAHSDDGDVPATQPKQRPTDEPRLPLVDVLQEPSGYTGTALSILQAGVPQVVAMRYSVGDRYARELALRFYRRLLADRKPRATESALALARNDVHTDAQLAGKLWAVDHANPLLFGQGGLVPLPTGQRSRQLRKMRPRPQPLLPRGSHELEAREWFVGRGRELTRLHRAWLAGGSTPAVALIQGLAGLGKTALAAEAIHLWHARFSWVLAYQGKPTELTLEHFYRDLDGRLASDSKAYRERCEQYPGDRIYLEPTGRVQGEARQARMQINLLETLRQEAILLVLDNFENNLEPSVRAGATGHACKEPAWDRLLSALASELPDTGSRLLVTSRHRLSALADARSCEWLPLGPLPAGEAALYMRNHHALSDLLFGDDEAQALIERVTGVSRGHPLILDRLAALAGDRAVLTSALQQLEKDGMKALPDVFSARRSEDERESERAYLEDVAIGSVDLLLRRLSADARRLLWMITLANEPVSESMLRGVWSGRSLDDERLEQLRGFAAMLESLPEEVRTQLPAIPEELRELLDRADTVDRPEAPPLAPLLTALYDAGLVGLEGATGPAGGEVSARFIVFHELVRERARAWIQAHPEESAGSTEESVWLAYGERYVAQFETLLSSGKEHAREAGAEAGRRALVYHVRAREFVALGGFASNLVISTKDPVVLRSVIAELMAVVATLPAGPEHQKTRWSVRTYLADALKNAGRPDQALSLFRQAASEAEAVGHWDDLAWIMGNWAGALVNVGQLDAARVAHLRSARAKKKAGRPRVEVFGSELEALRIDVMQGAAERVLPDIHARLNEVRDWWRRQLAGEPVPDAPDVEVLGRVFIGGLDVAEDAARAFKRWQDCLDLLSEIEQTKRARGESKHSQAFTRFNQYGPLLRLGRLDQAQRLLEGCLTVFRNANDLAAQGAALSSLANLWYARKDLSQAISLVRQALAITNRLPDPARRAASHHNLANYLGRAGRLDEALPHRLADIIYELVSGHRQGLSTSLRNLAINLRQAAPAEPPQALPRLAEVLALPGFDALARFLRERNVDVDKLQGTLDQLEAQARAAEPPAPTIPPALHAAVAAIAQAAAEGQDIEPLLAALRDQLLQAAPQSEAKIDGFIDELRAQLAGEDT